MTDWSLDPCDTIRTDRPSLPRKIFVRAAPALAAFSFSALVALRLAGGLAEEASAPASAQERQQERSAQAQALATPAPSDKSSHPVANPYGALFDPDGSLVGAPAVFADSNPVGPAFSPLQSEPLFTMIDPSAQASQMDVAQAEPAASAREAADAIEVPLPPLRQEQFAEAPVGQPDVDAPVPPARPSELSIQPRVGEIAPPARAPETALPRRETARAIPHDGRQATPLAQNDPRNFFEKIFGAQDGAGQNRPAPDRKGQQLAYAAPDAGGFNLFHGLSSAPAAVAPSGGGTAVYDISAHTVYLPNGEALEAHSGLGPYIDDPNHAHRRMQGPTPPAVYNLTLRESLFHGVQALRLTPVSGNVYGRNGLLAHTFMLGQRGDSNGCVSFRNYRAFLQAYMNGVVRRLVVVGRRG
jgi:hypothetical protein